MAYTEFKTGVIKPGEVTRRLGDDQKPVWVIGGNVVGIVIAVASCRSYGPDDGAEST